MNEEDEGFIEIFAQLAKEATHEAYLRARKLRGEKGILLAKEGQLIRLFPDDSFEVIKDLAVTTG